MKIDIHEAELKKFYDNVYADGDIRDNKKLYDWIIKLVSPVRGKTFLDIACGGGWMLAAAVKKNLKTYGLDISSNAIEKTKKVSPGSNLIVGSGEKLPWPDNSFDYLTCLGSIEHYIHPEIGIKEIVRVLKKDGTCAIMLPNKFFFLDLLRILFRGDTTEEEWQIVERRATLKGWCRFLEENGLKVKKIYKYNKYPELFKPGTLKMKSIGKFFISAFIRYFSPFNFAWQFVYICKKI